MLDIFSITHFLVSIKSTKKESFPFAIQSEKILPVLAFIQQP